MLILMPNQTAMKKTLLLAGLLLFVFAGFSQTEKEYCPTDPGNPVIFKGSYITYKGNKIELGPHAFFIDGQLTDEEASEFPYVFNSVNKAVKQLNNGTENSPMVLYMAPWVYWIDNPDSPDIRLPGPSGLPLGLDIKCRWLRFCGLSDDPGNVVLACNRGQTMGAKGNFTMFRITGDGTSAENVTFGNYCNIDLEYPLKPEFNRKKRGSAIVQAQLVICDGDKLLARNTRFVSRLNLVPFYGGKRTLFDHCHFESTDDALAPRGVYLNCTFDFYSSKPFGHTEGTGAVLLNCDITSFTRGEQYFVKGKGQLAAVDCRLTTKTATYWGWKEKPAAESVNYQYNDLFNGKKFNIGSHHPYSTVDMTNKAVLNAYRIEYRDSVFYNIYNLLRGNDDWDPMGMKQLVLSAEKENGKRYINLPVQLLVSPARDTIETGKDKVTLIPILNKFGDYEIKGETIGWSVVPPSGSIVRLNVKEDGTCELTPANGQDETKKVVVKASSTSGLEAASVLYIAPPFLEAPKFIAIPGIVKENDGRLSVRYKLDMTYPDQSLISWYRCTDNKGSHPVETAVSRFNKPKFEYRLSAGDIGYYIMAKVAPKHLRCHAGTSFFAITATPVSPDDVKADPASMMVDLRSMSSSYQPEVKPGFWTLDSYTPADTREYDWEADNSKAPWYYGPGENGASSDTGFVQATKGARLRYTPVGTKFGDMKISFTAVPAKTAGQGFSSARAQYLDICIKFDTKTLTGYALRLIRTTKYHDAVDFLFMKYENGNATPISKPVSTSCFRPECRISLEAKGNKLIARADTPARYYIQPGRPEVVQTIDMKTEMIPNNFGGIEFQHTGTVGSGATLIKNLTIEWF